MAERLTVLASEHTDGPARGGAPAPILFVHDAGINWIRGSTRCLLDLLTHIDRSRFRPIVWCNQPVITKAIAALDVPVVRAADWHGCHPLRPNGEWIRAAGALVRRYGIRLIHADEFSQATVLVPVARAARIPVLVQLHQVPTLDERRWSWLHQVDLAVGTSRACITGLLEDGFPPQRATVIYNGVDPERLSAGSAAGLRPQLGLEPEAIAVTLVGSLIHRKAVDVAIRAFRALHERQPHCRLLLCGDGPERSALEDQARTLGVQALVHFLGERTDAGAVLRDATDILLATSRDESFGLTLAEAGVFAIPVVASAIDAHREVLGNGEAGMLVDPEDADGFADSLATLSSDAMLRRQYGESIRRRVKAMFLIDRYVRDFEETYSQLLARPAGDYGWIRGSRWPKTYTLWLRESVARRMTRLTGLAREGDGSHLPKPPRSGRRHTDC